MFHWERLIALGCAVAGVVLLLTTLSFVAVDGGLTQRTALLLLAGLALVIAYGLADPRTVLGLVRARRAPTGTISVLGSALVIGILVAVNVIASRGTQTADFTRSGLHTLSVTSMLATRQLNSDLVVTGFFRPDEQATRHDAETLLNLYRQQSAHVKVRFVDPDQDTAEALSLGVTVAGSIVLQYRNKPPVVLNLASQTESDVTGAILRLVSNRTPVVCWGSGDGERDLKDANQVSGYSAVSDLLRTSDYKVQDLLLVQQGVPATCDVVILLELGRPLSDGSVAAIQAYLSSGGKLLMGVDPWVDPKIVASANAVLQPFGVSFDGGLVVELDPAHSVSNDSTISVVYDYGQSPITRNLAGRFVFLPLSTPLHGSGTSNTAVVDLASSTNRSYLIAQQRTNLDRRAIDKTGPFVLMQALEEHHTAGKATRIVLTGSSGLAENRTMPPNANGSNADLLLASLDWLSGQDSLITIGPKPAAAAPWTLSALDARVNEVLTVGVMPLLVLAIGAVVYLRRRRRVSD